VYEPGTDPTALLGDVTAAASSEDPRAAVRSPGLAFIDSELFLDPSRPPGEDPALALLRSLDRWIAEHPDASATDLRTWLSTSLGGDGDGRGDLPQQWQAFRARLADSLVAALVSAAPWPPGSAGGRPNAWVADAASEADRWSSAAAVAGVSPGCCRAR
jgi:hypothetical protein